MTCDTVAIGYISDLDLVEIGETRIAGRRTGSATSVRDTVAFEGAMKSTDTSVGVRGLHPAITGVER